MMKIFHFKDIIPLIVISVDVINFKTEGGVKLKPILLN